jgi:hypothetical protein
VAAERVRGARIRGRIREEPMSGDVRGENSRRTSRLPHQKKGESEKGRHQDSAATGDGRQRETVEIIEKMDAGV